jgi:hypothetical protein
LDEIRRLRALIEVYESALAEVRRLADPELDELEVRLECRAAQAAYEHEELLRPLGAHGRVQTLPRRSRR